MGKSLVPFFGKSHTVGTSVLITALSLWIAARFLDHRPFADYGFHQNRNWWMDLTFGLVLGALMMTGIFLVEWAAGWVSVTGMFQVSGSKLAFRQLILLQLVQCVSACMCEEMQLRGYPLRNLAEGFNFSAIGSRSAILLAWLLSAIGFGLLHMLNPNASALSTISVAFAGLMLGLGYILTGNLAISIGLHTTWNFFEASVFGFPLSGQTNLPTFIAIKQAGPKLLTGGAFGPEAGLLGIAAFILCSILILLWVRKFYGEVGLYTPLAKYSVYVVEQPKTKR
jgi:membrane protease YdiL (CAAX protease family)